MGTIADSLFSVLMSWARALVNAIWALFSSDHTTILEFLGKNWVFIAGVIVAAGLVIDWLVWLVRWRPYHIFAMRVRRMLGIADPEPEPEERMEDTSRYAPPREPQEEPQWAGRQEEQWLPLEPPVLDEEDEAQAMRAAESVPDASLGHYPGMRYDDSRTAQEADMDGTRRYAAVHAEGPGAAEVNRRRAEIDAWQLQMQEEARQRAEAERAAREAEQARLAQEAYEAEQARLAQEAYEAEQARLAQEAYEAEQAQLAQEAYEAEQARLAQEAYEAEQARLAQEEYERQLAEYERQKAQYERDLAEYERQKAEYEAALALQQAAANADVEAGQDMGDGAPPAAGGTRRRRRTGASYSDYVDGEDVGELPDPPAWPQMERRMPAPQSAPKQPKAEKKSLLRGGVAKMARMIEPEDEEVTGITSLPPRVDPSAAYRPAKKPPKR